MKGKGRAPNSVGNVLIVAFHYPPCSGNSGVLRSLKFSRYLPEFGWQPVVLTVHPRVYEHPEDRRLPDSGAGFPVVRAFALDTKRHLALRGHYPAVLALPDRWASWALGGVPAGLRAISKYRTDIILTTFPIATSVLIGLILHRLTGRPWVVDLRDTMTEEDYPRDPLTRRIWRWLERQAVRHASRLIFTARSAVRMYLTRYPDLAAEKCLLISNGYDEEDFQELVLRRPRERPGNGQLRLLHSGALYPEERDPRPFFQAIARLKQDGKLSGTDLRIEFRAPGWEDEYHRIIRDLRIDDVVHVLPRVPHRKSLQDCADADGLLLFQAAWCDHQIPAKVYEYLRLRRPILALTPQAGDTAALLEEVGGATIVDLADQEAICHTLPVFLRSIREGTHPVTDEVKSRPYERRKQAQELARCLSELEETASAGALQDTETLAR